MIESKPRLLHQVHRKLLRRGIFPVDEHHPGADVELTEQRCYVGLRRIDETQKIGCEHRVHPGRKRGVVTLAEAYLDVVERLEIRATAQVVNHSGGPVDPIDPTLRNPTGNAGGEVAGGRAEIGDG